ncbi:MAG TPA: CDP-alcohol phosphatidyltransferase family protein [Aggregatilineales bacterium]|nr:CDP-alcohol phosphatidyltransferase family protein [Aggregatilineales bacterium]
MPPRAPTLNDRLRFQTRGLTRAIGAWGARNGIDPDAVTIAGLLVTFLAAAAAAAGSFLPAGILLILGSLLDGVDGAIARALPARTRFGALLDSTCDRLSDGALFFGIAYYYTVQNQPTVMALAITALIAAFTVSYVRARAEGLDVGSIREGWFDRTVRIVILIAALLTGGVVPGLAILAVGSAITAVQRIVLVYRATRDDNA